MCIYFFKEITQSNFSSSFLGYLHLQEAKQPCAVARNAVVPEEPRCVDGVAALKLFCLVLAGKGANNVLFVPKTGP